MRVLVLLTVLVLGLVLAAVPRDAHAADRGLAGEFMCQCGCGLTLANCTHLSCGPRDQALAEIARLEGLGRTRGQIRAAFIQQYGEGVLAAPLRRGFNLLAYWGPYWVIISGALAILALAAAWTRRPKAVVGADDPGLTAEQRDLLERELRNLKD